MARPDYTEVQLTAAGIAMAGEAGTVSCSAGLTRYVFRAGVPQQVETRFEWNQWLSKMQFNGAPVLEVVPASVTETVTEAAAAPSAVSEAEAAQLAHLRAEAAAKPPVRNAAEVAQEATEKVQQPSTEVK